jgi:cytochrome P450
MSCHLLAVNFAGLNLRNQIGHEVFPRILAGGETVATFLAATVYYLLKTPEVYKAMRTEIRKLRRTQPSKSDWT